jgi:hypothetical protein
MKKIIFSLALLLFVSNLFSQAPTTPRHSRDYYLKKSKSQKNVAHILLAGGGACILTGLLIPKGEEELNTGSFFKNYKNDGIRQTFGGVGGLFLLGSIPFYVLSSKNERKGNAATISFNNQKVLSLQQYSFVLRTQPTLTLKIIL